MSHKRFVKDVGLIGIAQALTSLGGFLLLPIISKSLGSYDYGIWSQISVTLSLLLPLALIGLSAGFIRFLPSETDKERIREGFYSIIFFVIFTGFIISLLLFVSSDDIATILFKNSQMSYYVKISSILVLLMAIDQIALFYFRVFRQINVYSYLVMFQAFGKLLLTLLLLKMGFGLIGVIFALLIVQILSLFIAMWKIVSQIGFAIPRFNQLGEYLKYSAPLTPNSLIRWITDSSDRYMVGYFLGMSSVGIYSASCAIGNLIQLFISPIQMILFPEVSKLFDEGKQDQVQTYLSYSMKYFLFIAIPAVFGLSALSKPMLNILTTPEFVSGGIVIPVIALSGLLSGVFQIVINITHLVKKTTFNMYIHVASALINIILNLILIPIMGVLGAAIATLASYVMMVAICIYVSFKHITFDINHIFIIKCIVASSTMSGFVLLSEPTNTIELLIITILGAVIYLVVMISIKSFSQYEMNVLKRVFSQIYHFKVTLHARK